MWITEDGELKDIMNCKEGTIRNWLYHQKLGVSTDEYITEVVIILLKEMRELKKEE